jgi:hypothetical protein
VEDDGTIRVGKSNVLLDIVIRAYLDGWSADETVAAFDTLDLADVYSVWGYYLRHKGEVDEYLRQRQEQADEFWAKLEAEHSQAGLREQLLERLNKRK